jgi:hypothetical protein
VAPVLGIEGLRLMSASDGLHRTDGFWRWYIYLRKHMSIVEMARQTSGKNSFHKSERRLPQSAQISARVDASV